MCSVCLTVSYLSTSLGYGDVVLQPLDSGAMSEPVTHKQNFFDCLVFNEKMYITFKIYTSI